MLLNKIFQFVFLSLFVGLLSGCTTLHNSPSHLIAKTPVVSQKTHVCQTNHFEIRGKVGFSDGQNGGNAHLRWIQQNGSYQIRLYGPLGSGALEIYGNAKEVYLIKPEGKIISAKSPEHLIKDELGWTVPVSGLKFWVLGCPIPKKPVTHMQKDKDLRPIQFVQQSWQISYLSYKNVQGLILPYKLTLQNGPLRLKFIFNQWKVGS